MAKSGSKGATAIIAIDRESEVPVYRQIESILRRAIGRQELSAGERLASTRTLAKDWGVSRNTVLQVFETLTAEGFLESRVGDGTYVSEASPDAETPAQLEASNERSADFPFRGISRRGRLLVDEGVAGPSEKPVPFMPDVPDLQEFPMRTWLRMMNEVAGRLTGDVLVDVSNAGYRPLRQAIAHHVGSARGLKCTAEQVIVTSGSQQGLDLVTRMLVDRGEPVWMEEPGYMGIRAALRANGCNALPVPIDAKGIDLDAGIENYLAPKLICISPARQYPSGVTLAPDRRAALLDFASRTGSWVLEDDYDSEMCYESQPLPAMQSYDPAERVISMGTFSKTLLPSFRLGFLIVPPDLAEHFSTARAVIDRHAPLLEQMVLAEMMHRGLYTAHLRRMRVLYRERQQALLQVLKDRLDYAPPAYETLCGMHLVLPLKPSVDDRVEARQLGEHGVVARPLSIYYAGREKRQGLLLGFAAFPAEKIEKAGQHLEILAAKVDRREGALFGAA